MLARRDVRASHHLLSRDLLDCDLARELAGDSFMEMKRGLELLRKFESNEQVKGSTLKQFRQRINRPTAEDCFSECESINRLLEKVDTPSR